MTGILGTMLPAIALFLALPDRPTLESVPTPHAAAFTHALQNLLDINTVGPKDKPFIRAGGEYQEPWTRDASINSWNAASLLEPQLAQNTLEMVLGKNEQGEPIVQPDNQWWDKVIWILGAWNHYATTGDRKFLTESYGVARRVLDLMQKERFDAEFGLFQGPSFFNDGIAGYPAPPAPADDSGSTFVLDHKGTDKLMVLSTNCLYVAAYRTAALMAKELGLPETDDNKRADALRRAINRRLWMRSQGRYGYFLHGTGKQRGQLDPSQEGSGQSFAILFDVASKKRAASVLTNVHEERYGISDVWPHFERYPAGHPGRHNILVWPMVQGMWARAAVKMRNLPVFEKELTNLAMLAEGTKGNFYEIYDGKTGAAEGGWQSGSHTGSVPNQTWSATAYLSMVLNGVFGLRFEPKGLRFEPLVPKGWGAATLQNLPYRNATLNLKITGEGTKLRSAKLDGHPLKNAELPTTLSGSHQIELIMG